MEQIFVGGRPVFSPGTLAVMQDVESAHKRMVEFGAPMRKALQDMKETCAPMLKARGRMTLALLVVKSGASHV